MALNDFLCCVCSEVLTVPCTWCLVPLARIFCLFKLLLKKFRWYDRKLQSQYRLVSLIWKSGPQVDQRIDASQREWKGIRIKMLEKSFGEADIILQKLREVWNSSALLLKYMPGFSRLLWYSVPQQFGSQESACAVVDSSESLDCGSELSLRYFEPSSDPFVFIVGTTDMKILVLHVLAKLQNKFLSPIIEYIEEAGEEEEAETSKAEANYQLNDCNIQGHVLSDFWKEKALRKLVFALHPRIIRAAFSHGSASFLMSGSEGELGSRVGAGAEETRATGGWSLGKDLAALPKEQK